MVESAVTNADHLGQQRHVVVLSGPSGVGKATLKKQVIALAESDPDLPTYSMMPYLYTRQQRKGETNGEEFVFVTEQEILDYDESEVFRRRLYKRHWQAVLVKDLEAAFAGDRIRILAVTGPRYCRTEGERQMRCFARARIGDATQVIIEYVDDLPPHASGKYRYVINAIAESTTCH